MVLFEHWAVQLLVQLTLQVLLLPQLKVMLLGPASEPPSAAPSEQVLPLAQVHTAGPASPPVQVQAPEQEKLAGVFPGPQAPARAPMTAPTAKPRIH